MFLPLCITKNGQCILQDHMYNDQMVSSMALMSHSTIAKANSRCSGLPWRPVPVVQPQRNDDRRRLSRTRLGGGWDWKEKDTAQEKKSRRHVRTDRSVGGVCHGGPLGVRLSPSPRRCIDPVVDGGRRSTTNAQGYAAINHTLGPSATGTLGHGRSDGPADTNQRRSPDDSTHHHTRQGTGAGCDGGWCPANTVHRIRLRVGPGDAHHTRQGTGAGGGCDGDRCPADAVRQNRRWVGTDAATHVGDRVHAGGGCNAGVCTHSPPANNSHGVPVEGKENQTQTKCPPQSPAVIASGAPTSRA